MQHLNFQPGYSQPIEHLFGTPNGRYASKPQLASRQLLPRLAVHIASTGPQAEQAQTYAKLLASLLRAELTDTQSPAAAPAFGNLLKQGSQSPNLVIYSEPEQPRLKCWLFGPPACRVVSQLPVSTLVVRQPRWPLRHLLLVTRGQRMDYVAADWLVSLATPSRARVTVLALQPFLSASDNRALFGAGLTAWLQSDTPLGLQLRRIAGELPKDEIEAWLRLQFVSGPPLEQIQQTVGALQPDLIVIAGESPHWCERRLLGEIVTPLLRWAGLPVLVAKPH